VAEVARACGNAVVGFADRDPAKLQTIVPSAGAAVVVTEADLLAGLAGHAGLPVDASVLACGIGDNRYRRSARMLVDQGLMPGLVHPTATIARFTEIGKATVVCAAAVVNPGARIGAGVILNTGCIVEHDCVVGDDAHVSPGAVLCGAAQVGEGAWIGANATILPGVAIGAWAVVGAGAVVLDDVPEGVTVVGNPARLRQVPA
jgi:sugar O-acyltransferase (sialic acid O-acetyltransferase NeuD family)